MVWNSLKAVIMYYISYYILFGSWILQIISSVKLGCFFLRRKLNHLSMIDNYY